MFDIPPQMQLWRLRPMAVKRGTGDNSKKPVEEGLEYSYGEGAVSDTNTLFQLRKSDGPSNGKRKVNKDYYKIAKRCIHVKNQRKDNKPDSLSDIDDAEVFGYLNSKQEILYKTMLWEAINGNYKKPEKRKRPTKTKRSVSANRAAKTSENMELQKRSSRINYDALNLLNNELAEGF